MEIAELVAPDGVVGTLRAGDKRQAFGALAAHAARLARLDPQAVLEAILARERLGPTAVGEGVAIPHARLPDGPDRIYGVFARLSRPLPFDAPDDQPVDLLLLVIGPDGAGAGYLQALACAARALRDPERAARLRRAEDAALHAELIRPSAQR